jgi:hypothetical protein
VKRRGPILPLGMTGAGPDGISFGLAAQHRHTLTASSEVSEAA